MSAPKGRYIPAADASTLGWDISPLWGLYPWPCEHFLSILCSVGAKWAKPHHYLEQQFDDTL
ncbi:hypothetical protein HDF15_002833 [Granulicella mallensis]|uniref:Uncharacterized protein n=1 Tax=Granulicella mallensis TaxID=940614 RepID=A0A7W8EBF6_9BACT|nr:hypothetical protein [Granulicella mallensis]